MEKKNQYKSPSAPSNTTLAGRIYATGKLLQLYDLCNAHDALSIDSSLFQTLKASFQSKLENADADDKSLLKGMRAETVLNTWQLLDDNGKLKSDEILLAKMKEFSAIIRDREIAKITHDLTAAGVSLNSLGIKDIEKFKNNPHRGNSPNSLKEKLAEDFALIQMTDPTNILIQEIAPTVKKQISTLPYTVYWRPEDVKTNHQLRDYFDKSSSKGETTPRQDFLKFMGKLLSLGEDLTKQTTIPADKVSANNTSLLSYYDEIRKISGLNDLKNEEIASIAAKAYITAAEGCWAHKQKCNPGGNKAIYYKSGVSTWIKRLKEGRNDIAKLAFLSPKDQKDYDSHGELWQEQLAAKHISIDHKFDLKYHILLSDMKDKQLLNNLWNMQMIIGGSIHNEKTEETENNNKETNKIELEKNLYIYKIKVSKKSDSSILCTYATEKSNGDTSSIKMPIKEPEKISQLRQNSLSPSEQGITRNIFLPLRQFINGHS